MLSTLESSAQPTNRNIPDKFRLSHMIPDDITEEDIRLFRTSLLARRMPALKNMSDTEVKTICAADAKGVMSRREKSLQKSWPKTNYAKGTKTTIIDDGTFRPCSPSKAKSEAARPDDERFCLNLGTPYSSEHSQFVADQTLDLSKRCSGSDWIPSGGNSQAKETIRTKSTLNMSSHIYSK